MRDPSRTAHLRPRIRSPSSVCYRSDTGIRPVTPRDTLPLVPTLRLAPSLRERRVSESVLQCWPMRRTLDSLLAKSSTATVRKNLSISKAKRAKICENGRGITNILCKAEILRGIRHDERFRCIHSRDRVRTCGKLTYRVSKASQVRRTCMQG